MTITDTKLEFDFADRVLKAMRIAELSAVEVADALEVSRNTVGAWINGRNQPRRRDLRRFAEVTGVPLQWLETGKAPSEDGAGDPVRPEGFEPPAYCSGVSARETWCRWCQYGMHAYCTSEACGCPGAHKLRAVRRSELGLAA